MSDDKKTVKLELTEEEALALRWHTALTNVRDRLAAALRQHEQEANARRWSGSPEELSGYIEGSIEAAQEIARASERRRVCDAIERRLRDARNAIVPSMRRKMGPQVEADAHRHGLRQAIEIVRGMREGSDK